MSELGGYAISDTLFLIIRNILPEGRTILELGSGLGTKYLSEHYNMISVEHDEDYLDKYDSKYIYAPLKKIKPIKRIPDSELWYDSAIMKEEMPKLDYDLILIDGPPGNTRAGFIKYWDLFKHNVPMIFDDINRDPDRTIITKASARIKKPYTVYGAWEGEKHFGVILP
jgi:predicted O-methyltransferase YrrM